MKPLFTLLFLLLVFQSQAQTDWWCVLPGVKNYYINKSCYLRGTRIDSVKTIGNATILYPFKSPRGYYLNGEKLKSSGSWVSETIAILPDGTHYFDNFWEDTVVIKTQAVLNDTWTLFDDTSDIYYTATLSAIDTMTVLGVVDSIKEITVLAYNSGGAFTGDPLHNIKFTLSKAHGFVNIVDLFMFPFHEPAKTYQPGFDHFLTRTVGTQPIKDYIVFSLTHFHNPAAPEIYSYGVGDTLQYSKQHAGAPYGPGGNSRIVDEVESKIVNNDSVIFTIRRWTEYKYFMQNSTTHSIFQAKYGFNRLIDTSLMPEEWLQPNHFVYNPADSSYCLKSPLYVITGSGINPDMTVAMFPCGIADKYKIGFGNVEHHVCYEPMAGKQDGQYLGYTSIDGKSCGTYIPLSISHVTRNNVVKIYPNPASDILNIELALTDEIQTATIFNSIGAAVARATFVAKETFNVSDLPAGIYFINIQSKDGSSLKEKIVIQR